MNALKPSSLQTRKACSRHVGFLECVVALPQYKQPQGTRDPRPNVGLSHEHNYAVDERRSPQTPKGQPGNPRDPPPRRYCKAYHPTTANSTAGWEVVERSPLQVNASSIYLLREIVHHYHSFSFPGIGSDCCRVAPQLLANTD